MTAEQLANLVNSRILSSNISYDTEDTKIKVVYLGQTGRDRFFVLSVTPVDVYKATNAKAIKAIVELLDEIGFKDLHWRHFNDDFPDCYTYFMSISDDKMISM